MFEDFEKFFSSAKTVRLTPTERVSLWRSIELARPRNGVRATPVGTSWIPWLTMVPRFAPLAVVAFLLVAIGGVSVVAERSLPGEFLYPVKVSFNEEARAVLAFSDEAEADWEVRRLGRRLEEAELLSQRGALDADLQTTLETQLDIHADEIELRIGLLEERGNVSSAAAISSDLEAALSTHEGVLAHIAGIEDGAGGSAAAFVLNEVESSDPGKSPKTSSVSGLLKKVQGRRTAASQARTYAEAELSARVGVDQKRAAEQRWKAAEKKIGEAKNFVGKARARLGAEAVLDAEFRLDDAERAFAAGRTKFDASAYAEAFARFQEAHRLAQEAKLLVGVHDLLDFSFGLPSDPAASSDGTRGDEQENGASHEESIMKREFHGDFGELELSRTSDGAIRLEGKLTRSTPCTSWRSNVTTTKDLPPSVIEIFFTKEVAAGVCIQVLARPQEVKLTFSAADNARYTIQVDGKTIFSGEIDVRDESSSRNDEPNENDRSSGDEDVDSNDLSSSFQTDIRASVNGGFVGVKVETRTDVVGSISY